MTDTDFNGSIHLIIYILSLLKLEKSETGRSNISYAQALAE